jgi:hypothetical protein
MINSGKLIVVCSKVTVENQMKNSTFTEKFLYWEKLFLLWLYIVCFNIFMNNMLS